MFAYPAYLANFLGGTLKHCGFCYTHTVLFGYRKQQVSKTTAVRRRLKQGKAHSDIFLCGQSHDAMLATGVYSVIKKKKGVAESFSLTFEKTSSYPSTRWCKTCQNKRPSSGGEKCIQLEPTIQKTNTNPRGNKKGGSLLRLFALLPLLLTLPYDSTFLPGRGKAISRSHTWTCINVTSTRSTQQACLWETSGPHRHFSCPALTQLQNTMAF